MLDENLFQLQNSGPVCGFYMWSYMKDNLICGVIQYKTHLKAMYKIQVENKIT